MLEKERRDLRTQVAILKGEIELAKAQNQLIKEKAAEANAKRRGSVQSHKGPRKSSDRKVRTQSVSTGTGSSSYATAANYSLASTEGLFGNSEPNIPQITE